jgi:type IV pilus assembly protein PilY1
LTISSRAIFGNLWKFDVTRSDTSNWAISDSAPLFIKACAGSTCTTGSSSNYQPSTSRSEVGAYPSYTSTFLVYFGTGKYFESTDNSSTGQTTQSFYGVWDKNQSTLTSFNRPNLLQQTITNEVSQSFTTAFGTSNTYDLRVSSNTAIDWSTHKGWYIDLYNTASGKTTNYGERQVSGSLLLNGKVIITTLLPSTGVFTADASSWLMELDASSGGRLSYAPFDLDSNSIFNTSDYVTVTTDASSTVTSYAAPSGKKSGVGIIGTPGIIGSGTDADKEHVLSGGTTGDIETATQNSGPGFNKRTSCRELLH